MARLAEESARMDFVHRRTADGSRVCGLYAGRNQARPEAQGRAVLSRHVYRRAPLRPAYVRQLAERDDEKARCAIYAERGVSGVPRQALARRIPFGSFRRTRHRGYLAACSEAARDVDGTVCEAN